MRKRILHFLIASAVAGAGAVARAGDGLTATLVPTKASYFQGEPIEVLLAITNGTHEGAKLWADYPAFVGPRKGISVFPAAGRQRGAQPSEPLAWAPASWKVPMLPLDSGETWSVRVYLQRFIGELAPGTHDLEYSIDIECTTPTLLPPLQREGGGFRSSSFPEVNATWPGQSQATLSLWTSRLSTGGGGRRRRHYRWRILRWLFLTWSDWRGTVSLCLQSWRWRSFVEIQPLKRSPFLSSGKGRRSKWRKPCRCSVIGTIS